MRPPWSSRRCSPEVVYAALSGSAARPLGEQRLDRTRRRHVQIHRRRLHLETADAGDSFRRRRLHSGQHWDCSEQSEAALRLDRDSTGAVGIYRSDDAGEHWERATTDARPAGRIGGGDLSVPVVDPKNPDIVYVASTVAWKSVDGGKTWTGWRGAPGGDDYQRLWINPNHADTILLVSDQGADHHGERRPELEFLVQPGDRADVPRERRQRLPVPRVRRPAGERFGLCFEPWRRRPDHLPGMASGGSRGVRLRGARPAESEYRLWRQGHPLRPADRAGREHLSGADPPGRICGRCARRRWSSRRPIRT